MTFGKFGVSSNGFAHVTLSLQNERKERCMFYFPMCYRFFVIITLYRLSPTSILVFISIILYDYFWSTMQIQYLVLILIQKLHPQV